MDPRSPPLRLCLITLCLLGAARCSSAGENQCKCRGIPQFPLTKDPSSSCIEPLAHFRYACVEGYLRKAGTSNRITCSNGTWTTPSLECIRDPNRPPPPSTTATQGYTDVTLEIITATVTTFTSPPVSRVTTSSTSVTARTERAESTSPDLQVSSQNSTLVNVSRTEETEKSASVSTTTEHSTFNPQQDANKTKLGTTSIALITLKSVLIVCGLIGLAFKKFYRRPKENTCQQQSAEEQIPMNP